MKTSLLTLAVSTALLSLSAPAFAEAQYLVRVPANVSISAATPETPAEAISFELSANPLPPATVNELYRFNLADRLLVNSGNVSQILAGMNWSIKAGDTLPAGLALEGSEIVGTPTAKNEAGASFEVTGSYQDASGKQVYTIVVGGQVLKVTQISAGKEHTCAITTSGGAKCWGYNGFGQLGDNSFTSRLTPANVSELSSGVASISAGYFHTCAVMTSGGAKCWGDNSSGQIGDGSTTRRRVPSDVSGLSSVSKISAGHGYTCAVTNEGAAKCWGSAPWGSTHLPANISGLSENVSSIHTGYHHACVVTETGGARCWGGNNEGQLGRGTTSTFSNNPIGDVTGLTSGVVSISLGEYHTCAVTKIGAAKCWGRNSEGQLGDNTRTNRLVPSDVLGLSSGVVSVSAAKSYACAVTASGGVTCWGASSGGLGDGTGSGSLKPIDTIGLSAGVSSVSAGEVHACAMMDSGGVKCWGEGVQIGDGTGSRKFSPVEVLP